MNYWLELAEIEEKLWKIGMFYFPSRHKSIPARDVDEVCQIILAQLQTALRAREPDYQEQRVESLSRFANYLISGDEDEETFNTENQNISARNRLVVLFPGQTLEEILHHNI